MGWDADNNVNREVLGMVSGIGSRMARQARIRMNANNFNRSNVNKTLLYNQYTAVSPLVASSR